MDKISIWLRIGGTVSVSIEDAKKILDGDGMALQKAIEKDGFCINGETYIPGDEIGDLCKENGIDDSAYCDKFGGFKRFHDVDFSLNNIKLKCEPAKTGKELLRITNLKNTVCQAEINASTTHEKEMTGAALLSLMDQDEEFANLMLNYCSLYLLQRKKVSEANKDAIRKGEIKIKN